MSLQLAMSLAAALFILICIVGWRLDERVQRRDRPPRRRCNRRWPKGRPIEIGFRQCPLQEQQRT